MRRLSKRVVTGLSAIALSAGVMTGTAQANDDIGVMYACSSNSICFYTGSDGTGSKCEWYEHDTDWLSGSTTCSWGGTTNVRSIWNRKSVAVKYYSGANYTGYIGCTKPGIAGNLAGTYKVRSHMLVSSC